MADRRTLRTFYTLILTQTFSLIGSRMTGLAVAIKVFNDTDRATPLTIVAFLTAVPQVVSANVAGVLADRWDRRYVMMIADAGQALATFLLMLSFLSGAFELWHLYVLTVIQSIFSVFQGPAFDASVTMLVPDEHRDRANTIRQLTGPASGLIAPVLAGMLFAVVGAPGVMAIDLLTFGVAVVVILLIQIPRPPQSEEGRAMAGSVWKEASVGFRYLWARKILLVMMVHISLINFLITGAMVLNTPYILRITGSEELLGTLMGVTSAGAIVGGVIMSAWGGTRPRIHTIMPGIILLGVGLALYGVSRRPVTMGASTFFMMFWIPMINASFLSVMQIKTPPDLQGRVFSVTSQLSLLLLPLSYLIAGPLADRVLEPAVGSAAWWEVVAPVVGSEPGAGIGLIMLVNGVVIALVSVAFYAIPAVRRFERTLPDYIPEKIAASAPGDMLDTGTYPTATPAAAV